MRRSKFLWWGDVGTAQVRQLVAAKDAVVRSRRDNLGWSTVKNMHLIDVRSTHEVASGGCIAHAVVIPLAILADVLRMPVDGGLVEDDDFEEVFGIERPLPGETQLILYSHSGGRSTAAMEVLEQMGFTECSNYCGGWDEWRGAHAHPTA